MKSKYKLLVDEAYNLHSKGDYDKAELIYTKLLELRPDDANVLNLYGLLLISLKNYEKSITMLTKAFLYNKSAYVAENLAKAYYLNNETENSVKIYKQALEYEENDDIYYSLALSYKKLNDYENVINCYLKAIEINPDNYNALYNITLAYSDIEDDEKAIYYGLKAYEKNNCDIGILTVLASLYEKNKDYNSAIKFLESAVKSAPDKAIYFYNLGVLYSKINNKNLSLENYKKALIINPNQIEAYVNIASLYKQKNPEFALEYLKTAYKIDENNEMVMLAMAQIYKDLNQNEKSCDLLNKIIGLNPNSAEAYSLLGINAMDTVKYDKALEYSNKALAICPDNLNYLHEKAIALKYCGKLKEAKSILERIVKSENADNQSKIALGMLYLQEKDFQKGMPLYSVRNSDTKFPEKYKEKIWSKPLNIKNKKVLIYSNCGLGDTIMYSRFFPQIANRAEKVIVQTDFELTEILKNNFPQINFINKSENTENCDVVIPVMDLQYALDIDFTGIDGTNYLRADDNLVNKFSEIFATNKKKAGLFWHGNGKIFKNRAIPADIIQKISTNSDYQFYSLQIKDDMTNNPDIISLSKYIKSYNDTAALLKNIDILITIDSSIAHMAGALGIITFLLLPQTAEWRWFFDTDKTIWYKSIKIFKQKSYNNWFDVLDKVNSELNNYAG